MSSGGEERRLNSWKEIGAFFGKDERTVKRWETQRGLPIHRIPGGPGARVYAYASELEAWLRGAANEESAPADRKPSGSLREPQRLARAAASVLAIAILLAALGYVQRLEVGETSATAEAALTSEPVPADAVELYLSGVFNLEKRTPESLNRAVEEFGRAIGKYPRYAEAYVGLANCYNLLREYTIMPAAEAYPRAKEAAERAIALNDRLAEAHTSLAFVEFYWTRDIARAKREFERSLELDPNGVRPHHWYATALLHTGDFEHALAEITKAQTLDPKSRAILADKGLILFYAGAVEEAVQLLKDLARSEPDYLSPTAYLAGIYLAEKRYPDFFDAAKEAARLIQDDNRAVVIEAAEAGYAASGERGMFDSMVAEQLRLYAEGKESAWRVAQTYAAMGDPENALRYLRASLDRHEEYPMAIRIEPAFEELHSNASFKRMVVEVGMPPL